MTEILGRYFSQSADLYSAELVTQAFVYGSKVKNTYPPDHFYSSELYQAAAEGKGRIAWVPTYDYTRMHALPELAGTDIDYRYIFSAVRQINPSCVRNDIIVRASKGSEKPALVMNFKDDVYANIFRDSIPIQGSVFLVASENGTIISHQDKMRLGTVESAAWLKELRSKGSGTTYVTVGGRMDDRLLRPVSGDPLAIRCADSSRCIDP